MTAADARRRVSMVAANEIGLILKCPCQKGMDCLVRTARRTWIESDSGLLQCKARTCANAAADECIDGICL